MRRSRLLVAVLCMLGVLAGASCMASGLPRPLAWALAAVAIGWGFALARCERRRASSEVAVDADGTCRVDGAEAEEFDVDWRGSLAILRWRQGGRVHRRAWWPDASSPADRRELRLALMQRPSARGRDSMAP